MCFKVGDSELVCNVIVCFRVHFVYCVDSRIGKILFICLSQYLTNLMHKICFTISFISCLYMFRAHVLIIRRSKY